MSETKMIGRARQGDGAAWEDLMREHQGPVYRLAYLLLGDADDAEDVAQEVFIRAYGSLDRFDAARPLRPWLLRITSNLAYNRRRSAARYLAALGRLVRAAPEPLAGAAQNRDPAPGEAEALWGAIRRLKRADQEVIYLRYFLELSVAETAEATGITPGTVKSRSSRALERLRGVIRREFPGLWKEHVT